MASLAVSQKDIKKCPVHQLGSSKPGACQYEAGCPGEQHDGIQIPNAGVQRPAGGPAAKPKELGLHVQKTTCRAKNGTKNDKTGTACPENNMRSQTAQKKTKLYQDTNWTYTKHWTVNIDPRRTMGRHELGAKHGMLRGDVKSHKNKTTQVHKNLCQTRRGRRRTSWRTRATRGEDHEDGEYVERGLHQRAALQKELTKQRPQTKKSSFLNSSVDILSYPPIHNTSPTSFLPPHPPSPVIQCLNI